MTASTDSLYLKFGGRLVEQLGAQMYPSATATVAELISNAWDADARRVWVTMPFGDWENGEIVVVDDGVGMDLVSAQVAYLIVGRNRRKTSGERTRRGRLVHGRKGIGKLAAFGTARVLELKTLTEGGEEVAFRLDYEKIRSQDPDQPYRVEPSLDTEPLADPTTGAPLSSGTRIRLSELQLKRSLHSASFMKSMSRRFAIDDREMSVFINGERLQRYDIDLEFRFPRDGLPPEASQDGDWAVEALPDGRVVRWWIGFTPKPLKDHGQQGVSVIVRGKLAQRPFRFDAGGGTTNQLGQEYLVGEVEADWIDSASGGDENEDFIQSNRDQLQLEAEDLDSFMTWGQQRVRWALNQRGGLKRKQADDKTKRNKKLDELLDGRPKRERTALNRVAAAIAGLPDTSENDVVKVMRAVVEARTDETARSIADDIALSADAEELWSHVRELAEIDGRSSLSFIAARAGTVDRLRALDAEAVPGTLVKLLQTSPGVFKPSWDTAAVDVTSANDYWLIRVVPQAGAEGTVVLVVPRGDISVNSEAVTDVVAAERDAGNEVVTVTAGDEGPPGGATWHGLLAEAEAALSSWRDLVIERVRRASEA